eukprot:UN22835
MEHHPNCVKLRKVEAEAPDYEDIASDYNEHLTDPYLRAAAQNNEPQLARVQLSSSKNTSGQDNSGHNNNVFLSPLVLIIALSTLCLLSVTFVGSRLNRKSRNAKIQDFEEKL